MRASASRSWPSELACTVRFAHPRRLRASPAGSWLRRGRARGQFVYFDLGMSSMQVDNRERGFSYSYDAPLDMRMDPDHGSLTAREILAGWDERQLARTLRDYGEERPRGRDRPCDRAPPRAGADRDHPGSGRDDRLRDPRARPLRRRASRQALLPGAAHRRQRRASPSSSAALPLAWELLREHGVLAGISFHSLEDRRVKRFMAARAQGCICPPDLPVCGCGRTPEATLLTRRSIVPSAGELASNPRSSSARLHAPPAGWVGNPASSACPRRLGHPTRRSHRRARARRSRSPQRDAPRASAAASDGGKR